jgi:RimJ/RimL family protein N-acetyltransferase
MGFLPQFRGRGIGTNLIRPVLAASRSLGLHRVELRVRENNASSIGLHKKVGFEIKGLQRDAARIERHFHESIVCMAILL